MMKSTWSADRMVRSIQISIDQVWACPNWEHRLNKDDSDDGFDDIGNDDDDVNLKGEVDGVAHLEVWVPLTRHNQPVQLQIVNTSQSICDLALPHMNDPCDWVQQTNATWKSQNEKICGWKSGHPIWGRGDVALKTEKIVKRRVKLHIQCPPADLAIDQVTVVKN